MHNQTAIERLIMLCRTQTKALLQSHDLQFVRCLKDQGLALEVRDRGDGTVSCLIQQEHLESIIGASLEIADLELIKFVYPDRQPMEVAVKAFAEVYNISSQVADWTSSVEQLSGIDFYGRITGRCKAVFSLIPHLVIILDKDWRHIEASDPKKQLVTPWENMVGKTIEELEPLLSCKAINAIHTTTCDAFRYTERPQYVTYDLSLDGLPRRYRAKIIAYGGERQEAMAIVQDITVHQHAECSRCA